MKGRLLDNIKTRALKGNEGWRSVSIPTSIYSKLAAESKKKGESISLILRKLLGEHFEPKAN